MKKYSYNCGRPVNKFVVPTLAETMNLFDKLKASKKLFRVDFIKRTTGEMRTMICQFGVKKYLHGGSASYHFGDKGLLSVFEHGTGYRSIPIDNILFIKFAGAVYHLNSTLPMGTYTANPENLKGRSALASLFNEQKIARTIPASTSPMYLEAS